MESVGIEEKTNQEKQNFIGAGGLILDLSTNKILVVKGPDKWSLPKGHLEPGENPHEGAMREIFEETSLQIEIDPQCRSQKLKKYIYYYIILDEAQKLTLVALDQREISEVKWCSYEDLLGMDCNRQLQYFIERWKKIIKVFHDHQQTLLLKGTVPSTQEREQIQLDMAKEHSLRKKTFETSKKPMNEGLGNVGCLL
jgi:ADP-ribose pyrophosphatase YjhB (NUDIX family)